MLKSKWIEYFWKQKENDNNWETFHKQLELCQRMAKKYHIQYMVEGSYNFEQIK